MRAQGFTSAKSGAWLMRALGLAVLLWLFSRAEWPEFEARFSQLDPAVMYLSPPLTVILFLLRAWRWKLLLAYREQQLQLSLCRAWSIYAIGFFLGVITPGRLGDMAKAAFVRKPRTTLQAPNFCKISLSIFIFSMLLFFYTLSKYTTMPIPIKSAKMTLKRSSHLW